MCVQYCNVANSLDAEIGLALSNNHLCSEKLEVVNNRIEDLRKQVSVSFLHVYLYTTLSGFTNNILSLYAMHS